MKKMKQIDGGRRVFCSLSVATKWLGILALVFTGVGLTGADEPLVTEYQVKAGNAFADSGALP